MKKYLIAIVIVLVIIDALIIGALYLVNQENKGNEVDVMAGVDREFVEERKDTKGELYSDVLTEYIIEKDFKETFQTKTAYVNILKRMKDDKIYVSVVPASDLLGRYEMMKNTNNGYGVFSYTSQGKGEERYRCFIKDNRVIAVTDFEKNVWFEPRDKCSLNAQEIANIEKAYKYYINFEIENE